MLDRYACNECLELGWCWFYEEEIVHLVLHERRHMKGLVRRALPEMQLLDVRHLHALGKLQRR